METVHAIYENGSFRALVPVSIPDGAEVVFEPRLISAPKKAPPMTLYRLLDQRFATGQPDLAARHNEHQP